MNLAINWAIIGLAMLSNFLQLFLIIKGRVTIPRVSWIIWFVIIAICFVINLLFEGWDTATIFFASYTVGNLSIVGYILAKNSKGWTKRETKLLVYVFMIILIWIPFRIIAFEKTLMWATITSLILLRVIHFTGVWKYWNKIWKDPFKESLGPWLLRWTSGLIACVQIFTNQSSFASKTRMWMSFSQPSYLTATVFVTLFVIVLRRRKLKRT